MDTVLALIVIAARFLAGLWPLMFLGLLVGIFKQNKGFGIRFRSSIKALLFAWGFFALLHLTFFFLKMETFKLIPDPENSQLFLAVGLMLIPFAFAFALEERHNHKTADSIAEMRALSPSEFEALVAETYRSQGHTVEIVGGTGDHGIDLVVHSKTNEIWFVQCKRYKGKIGEPVVRDFYGAMRASNVDSGAIITTGSITDQARLWAEGKPIRLYDGAQFLKIVTSTRTRVEVEPEEDKVFARRKADQPSAVLQPAFGVAGAVSSGFGSLISALTPRFERESAPSFESVAPVVAPQAEVIAPRTEGIEPQAEPVVITSSAAQIVLHSEIDDPIPVPEAEVADKAPFMNMSEPPECPVCKIPMVEKTIKPVLGTAHVKYVCQNSPDCRVTLPKE